MRYLQAYTYRHGTGLYHILSRGTQEMITIVPQFALNNYSYSFEVPWTKLVEYEVFADGTGI